MLGTGTARRFSPSICSHVKKTPARSASQEAKRSEHSEHLWRDDIPPLTDGSQLLDANDDPSRYKEDQGGMTASGGDGMAVNQ